MKLSEAILKGCEIAPAQRFGDIEVEEIDGVLSACVWGAAALALEPSVRDVHQIDQTLRRHFGSLFWFIDGWSDFAWELIAMNDDEQKSREEIAHLLAERGL